MQPNGNQQSDSISSAEVESPGTTVPAEGTGTSPVADAPWQYTGGVAPGGALAAQQQAPQSPALDSVEWTASEYIAHEKPLTWYVALGLMAAVIGILAYFLTKDVVSLVVVLIVAVLFGVSAARHPQVRRFRIDSHGIAMGSRFHSFGELKSFSVNEDGPIKSLVFMPMKRYMIPVSMYFPPEQEQQIVSVISQYLPFEPARDNNVDRVMRRIRF